MEGKEGAGKVSQVGVREWVSGVVKAKLAGLCSCQHGQSIAARQRRQERHRFAHAIPEAGVKAALVEAAALPVISARRRRGEASCWGTLGPHRGAPPWLVSKTTKTSTEALTATKTTTKTRPVTEAATKTLVTTKAATKTLATTKAATETLVAAKTSTKAWPVPEASTEAWSISEVAAKTGSVTEASSGSVGAIVAKEAVHQSLADVRQLTQ
ncbi:hypothetical protein E2C01_006744 [Portunus trituberculatus]|uniref:Uncharacterized protein n=1 Tax=Portunus trituberculatus TaxID=210409 RepID=A0A5B7CYN4_PORTR|nr:hypothetical protein [Portunus trituberculatus]